MKPWKMIVLLLLALVATSAYSAEVQVAVTANVKHFNIWPSPAPNWLCAVQQQLGSCKN